MEDSYYCFEQLEQMRSFLDDMAMIKMVSDAGFDVSRNPIVMSHYHQNYIGDIDGVFLTCIERAFGTVETIWNEIDSEYEVIKYRISFDKLRKLHLLLPSNQRSESIQNLTQMMEVSTCDDFYFSEIEMVGGIFGEYFQIKITYGSGFFSPLLEGILLMRESVLNLIRHHESRMINNLRKLIIAKIARHFELMVDFTENQSWEDVSVMVKKQIDPFSRNEGLSFAEEIVKLQKTLSKLPEDLKENKEVA